MSLLTKMILKRLLVSLLVLLVVSLLIFAATLLLPGDPARAILGQQATPERVAALTEQLGLDRPAWERYLSWLGGVVTGDLGFSAATQGPVSELLGGRIAASALLLVLTALISTPVALALGAWAATRRGTRTDSMLSGSSLVLAALPEFVIGVLLVVLFATSVLQILPSVTIARPGEPVWARPEQLVLPVLTLALVVIPYVVRMTRATLSEALDAGFVEMARLKGLPERTVLVRHAVPHTIGPVAQVLALQLAWLAGGVVVVEFLFRYPGIGQALIDAVANRDVQVVQAITLIIAAFYVLVNLAADVAGILADPRIRHASGGGA
ncbi:peptide/nickel transport system permease protein [Pseudonocardia autotrophica]|uniref:Dipeptide transport system permease protein DppB n=2 Tax=Pseudonocardia TaxID=1847 RepID=A0A1Y2N6S5_PSEAH|nr:Dipeptide transport system permease protein DppB [Pseudonocardia autotrophica]TDN71664.1 peptide/nickel transport system permease protein [Pseudonocardia autotrophica]BBG02351.1 ABC transporter permease [Pseudonocardia autotrophica]GEC23313.1 ABC transporter permease [Pseudonocardia saturnea]